MVAVWDSALKEIRSQINDRQVFETFFEGTYIDKITDKEIVIRASTELACGVLKRSFMKTIRNALGNEISDDVEITFVYKSEEQEREKSEQSQPLTFFSDSKINRKFTFDNFIIGPSNK